MPTNVKDLEQKTISLNINDITSLPYKCKRVGKDLVVDRRTSQTVTQFLDAKELLKLMEQVIKEQGNAIITQQQGGVLKGVDWSLFIAEPSKMLSNYKITDSATKPFYIEVVQRVPFDQAIEEYFNKHGEYPDGVSKREIKPVTKIMRSRK